MVVRKVTVVNEQGVHMRPAGMIAKLVKEFPECLATLEANKKTVKANSPMQIMSACMTKGCDVKIVCEGKGEEALLDKIAKMFDDGFGE